MGKHIFDTKIWIFILRKEAYIGDFQTFLPQGI